MEAPTNLNQYTSFNIRPETSNSVSRHNVTNLLDVKFVCLGWNIWNNNEHNVAADTNNCSVTNGISYSDSCQSNSPGNIAHEGLINSNGPLIPFSVPWVHLLGHSRLCLKMPK